MDVFQLASSVRNRIQILVLQGKKVLREALIGKPGAHALPGRRADAEAPSARLCSPHGPRVRLVGRDVVRVETESSTGRRRRRVVREPAQSVDPPFVADRTPSTDPIEFIRESIPRFF